MEKNDKKLLNLYYVLIVVNIILFALAIYLCMFVFSFAKMATRILVLIATLVVLFLMVFTFDVLIIRHFANRWNVVDK